MPILAPRNKAKLSILSLSTSLNETTDGVIPTRTRELYNKLNKTEYDIICLQGINYSANTKSDRYF